MTFMLADLKKYNCELVSGENTNSLSVLLQGELFRR